jgi:pimeloyl-ACP methyl ester carboxylesterase
MATALPLILLPGQLCDAALWAPQLDTLADVADMEVADLTLDDSVGAMAARVLLRAPGRFALCGQSMGGYVAFEIVRRAPERVSHLALVNTSARADTEEGAERRARSVRAAQIGTFRGVTRHFLPGILYPPHAEDLEIAPIVLAMTERVGKLAFERQQAAAIGRPDSRALLGSIHCPTLVLGGAEDRVTPPELQREIAAGIPGARLEILEECGHLAPLEQPEQVNALMREWLTPS